MIELDARQDREPVFAALLNAFEQRYNQAETPELHDIWVSRLNTLNQEVTVTLRSGEAVQGTAIDVDDDGALIVETVRGEQRTFIAGEVTLRTASAPD